MKKFFGGLMVLIGTGMTALGALGGCIFLMYDGFWLNAVLSVLLIVFGLFFLVKGKKLYAADGESPATKRAVGTLMMIAGTILFVGGAVFVFIWTVLEYQDVWVIGAVALVFGLIYMIAGKNKLDACKIPVQDHTKKKVATVQERKETPTTPSEPKKMVCQECGKEYPVGQVYCAECGSLLKEIF